MALDIGDPSRVLVINWRAPPGSQKLGDAIFPFSDRKLRKDIQMTAHERISIPFRPLEKVPGLLDSSGPSGTPSTISVGSIFFGPFTDPQCWDPSLFLVLRPYVKAL